MDYTNLKQRMEKSIGAYQEKLSEIRAGRANPAILNKVKVDYYGVPTPINQMAGISVPEARLIVIQPWDMSVLKDIEKAILASDIGINPNNDGKVIRLAFPELTEERRKELVKDIKKTAEEAKVAVRAIRRDGIDKAKAMQKNSEITEDDYLSNLYFDKNLHGLYNLVYYYKFDFFDLVMRKDILVLNDINIDDDNIYTKGVILSFTGIGYLNNKKIDNGYVINEPGSYELNVIGYNNNLIYNFEVVESPISKELDSYTNQNINLKDVETEEKSIALVVENPVTNKIIKSDYQNNIWYIVIPIVTLLVSISTFTLLGRRIKWRCFF